MFGQGYRYSHKVSKGYQYETDNGSYNLFALTKRKGGRVMLVGQDQVVSYLYLNKIYTSVPMLSVVK